MFSKSQVEELVNVTNKSTTSDAAAELGAKMQGRIVSRGEDEYARTRRVWNGAVENQPALFAVCETSADVQAAVRSARRHGVPLSVRGGGHDWAGRALCPGGLVIDLGMMRQVIVDPHARTATVSGGARIKDVAAAAGFYGLVAALGNCGEVGVTGLTLGGGYGPLNGRYGLAADNLLGAEVVLADGRRVTTGPDEEPELFWVLRGGGGNFGVVTSMRIQLHEARRMLAGSIVYPWTEAESVLRRYAAFAETMPDELGVSAIMTSGPDGQPALMLSPLWNGDQHRGERIIGELQALGTPQFAQLGPMTYTDMLAPFDAWVAEAAGCHWEIRTRSLPALMPGAIDTIISAVARKTSPRTAVAFHHFHGAATRIPANAVAFGLRQEHFMVEIIAGWEPDGSDGAAHRQWAQNLCKSLAPLALPGGYANLLGPDDREQAAAAYGNNAARLRALKRRFDPDRVFASAIPLPER
ncbi:FAD-binding oxidoreductase [Bradyrhizobium centrolobii]|uniref:FAD-binding oxidoreductase n=1 Tax=Bradyrhizobium centrolobii TaxID=1505087 RepID=UPI0007C4D050|nr:FAD-binding oxidoreductase [Bradyrhizobium centrolobii]